MTRAWIRSTPRLGDQPEAWHYTARFDADRPVAACDAPIDQGFNESRADHPERDAPDPVCPTCWRARQQVELYRRSIGPDRDMIARANSIARDLASYALTLEAEASEGRRLAARAKGLAERLTNTEGP